MARGIGQSAKRKAQTVIVFVQRDHSAGNKQVKNKKAKVKISYGSPELAMKQANYYGSGFTPNHRWLRTGAPIAYFGSGLMIGTACKGSAPKPGA